MNERERIKIGKKICLRLVTEKRSMRDAKISNKMKEKIRQLQDLNLRGETP